MKRARPAEASDGSDDEVGSPSDELARSYAAVGDGGLGGVSTGTVAGDGQAAGPSKAARDEAVAAPFTCSFPPTCHRGPPRTFHNLAALTSHTATFHAHVCSVDGCGLIFPDDRFMTLHILENHDALMAARQARGEKIVSHECRASLADCWLDYRFGCFERTCDRVFASPKKRRLHLIDAHAYPRTYFFSLPNKGIGDLVKRFGEGVSLVRPAWRARDPIRAGSSSDDEDDAGRIVGPRTPSSDRLSPETQDAESMADLSMPTANAIAPQPTPSSIDELQASMLSSRISVVPDSVRFGRKGPPGRR